MEVQLDDYEEVEVETTAFREDSSFAAHKYTILIACVIALTVFLVAGVTVLLVLSDKDEDSFNKEAFMLDSSLFLAEFQNEHVRLQKEFLQVKSFIELANEEVNRSDISKYPISFRQYENFVKNIYENEEISIAINFGFCPKVLQEERERYEALGTAVYGDEIYFKTYANGTFVISPEKDYYYPVFYSFPYELNKAAVGLDNAAEAKRRQALIRALNSQSVILSDGIRLAQGYYGVLSLLPLLSNRPENDLLDVAEYCATFSTPLLCDILLGYVTMVLRVDRLASAALAKSTLRHSNYQVIDLENGDILAESKSCAHNSGLSRVDDLEMSDRIWRIAISQCIEETPSYSDYKWAILGIAILLTTLIVFSMVLLRVNTKSAIASEKARRLAERDRSEEEKNRLIAEQQKVTAEVARVRAEQVSQAKARFLSNMSHELRTPLNGVIGTIDILTSSLPTDVLRRHTEDFETISNCADVLLTTINDILDVNKLNSGKMKLHHSFFSIDEVIVACLSTTRVNAHKKQIAISKNVPKDVRIILSDQVRITQVILNFVSNAVKFTPVGGKISVSLTWGPEEAFHTGEDLSSDKINMGMTLEEIQSVLASTRADRKAVLQEQGVETYREQMLVCVEDNGIGISQDKLVAIFQPFEQADASVTRAFGGSGLGLSICKQLANLLGGRVMVESEVGKGSKFYVSLPLDVVKNESLQQVLAKGKNGPMTARQHKLMTASTYHLVSQSTSSGDIETAHEEEDLTAEDSSPLIEESAAGVTPVSSSCKGKSPKGGRNSREEKLKKMFGGKKVLVVEDNLLNQKVFCKYLATAGVVIRVECNGHLGVTAAREEKFDLILMDCHMPVMDGYDAAKSITDDETCINNCTPIIALTADVEASNRQSCETCGMVDFLTKPLQSVKLYNMMQKYLASSTSSTVEAS